MDDTLVSRLLQAVDAHLQGEDTARAEGVDEIEGLAEHLRAVRQTVIDGDEED